jgi:hypothetical protein
LIYAEEDVESLRDLARRLAEQDYEALPKLPMKPFENRVTFVNENLELYNSLIHKMIKTRRSGLELRGGDDDDDYVEDEFEAEDYVVNSLAVELFNVMIQFDKAIKTGETPEGLKKRRLRAYALSRKLILKDAAKPVGYDEILWDKTKNIIDLKVTQLLNDAKLGPIGEVRNALTVPIQGDADFESADFDSVVNHLKYIHANNKVCNDVSGLYTNHLDINTYIGDLATDKCPKTDDECYSLSPSRVRRLRLRDARMGDKLTAALTRLDENERGVYLENDGVDEDRPRLKSLINGQNWD